MKTYINLGVTKRTGQPSYASRREMNIFQRGKHQDKLECETLAYVDVATKWLILLAAIIGSISDGRGETTIENR